MSDQPDRRTFLKQSVVASGATLALSLSAQQTQAKPEESTNAKSPSRGMEVLIAGESWEVHSTHIKGFDSFTTSFYEEGVGWLKKAIEQAGHKVHFMPNHLVPMEFPGTVDDLKRYSVVILSDCGTNSLLLHPDTCNKSIPTPNRVKAVHDYVNAGGALLMIGGWCTFQGFRAMAGYHGTAIENALPVVMQATDDRVEIPEGARPVVLKADHPILKDITEQWPAFLGYNRLTARPKGNILLRINDDPFLVVWDYGQGRAAAFASDCAPHWGPPGFLNWTYYNRFWAQLTEWLAKTR